MPQRKCRRTGRLGRAAALLLCVCLLSGCMRITYDYASSVTDSGKSAAEEKQEDSGNGTAEEGGSGEAAAEEMPEDSGDGAAEEDAEDNMDPALPSGSEASDGELFMTMCKPRTLNPLQTEEDEAAQLEMILFMPLVDFDAEGNMTDRGALEKVEVSENGKTLTLTLKEKMKFCDGSAVEVSDVAFTLNAFAAEDNTSWWHTQLGDVEKATAMKDQVVVTMKSLVDPEELRFLCVPLLPAKVYGRENAPVWEAVGSGPYMVEDCQTMQYITLMTNPFYKGEEPRTETIHVRITRTEDAEQTSFEHGITQILYEPHPTRVSIDNTAHHQITFTDTQKLRFLFMNQAETRALSSPQARKAVRLVLDVEGMISQTALHLGTPAKTMVPDWIADITQRAGYEQDLEKAASLWPQDVYSLFLIVEEGDELSAVQGTILKESLQQIGVTLVVRTLNAEAWQQALEEGGYDLAFSEKRFGSIGALKEMFGSEGRYNYSQAENTDLDALLEACLAAGSDYVRSQACEVLDRYMMETLPVCPLYYTRQSVIVSRRVNGSLESAPTQVLRGIGNLG